MDRVSHEIAFQAFETAVNSRLHDGGNSIVSVLADLNGKKIETRTIEVSNVRHRVIFPGTSLKLPYISKDVKMINCGFEKVWGEGRGEDSNTEVGRNYFFYESSNAYDEARIVLRG